MTSQHENKLAILWSARSRLWKESSAVGGRLSLGCSVVDLLFFPLPAVNISGADFYVFLLLFHYPSCVNAVMQTPLSVCSHSRLFRVTATAEDIHDNTPVLLIYYIWTTITGTKTTFPSYHYIQRATSPRPKHAPVNVIPAKEKMRLIKWSSAGADNGAMSEGAPPVAI